MFDMPEKPRTRHTGSRIFIALAFILLAAGVLFVVLTCHIYFRYQRYQRALEYTFGSTARVVVTLDGERILLSSHNRLTLYSMLSDSSGTRREWAEEGTERFTFYTRSAVGEGKGEVADAGDGWVSVRFSYEDGEWAYTFKNRMPYAQYIRTVSPEGWLQPNTVLKNGAED